ncbi:MAG: phosphatase PAP2 family protein [Polyangiaceae bacterium]
MHRLHDLWTRLRAASLRWLVLFASLVVFLRLAWELRSASIVKLDLPVQRWLQASRTEGLTAAMETVTHFGDGPVIATVAVVGTGLLLFVGHHRRSAAYLALAASGAGLLVAGLKAVFARDRPIDRLVPEMGFAFPSGHSLASAATYGAIALLAATRFPKLRLPIVATCVLLVLTVGLSRAYLFVHYPSDVLAGWALGVAWALWLKPVAIGPGMRPSEVPVAELAQDDFDPEALAAQDAER